MGIGIVAVVNECNENKKFDTFDIKVNAIGFGYHLKEIFIPKSEIKPVKVGDTIYVENNHKFYNPRLLLTITANKVYIVQ